MKSVISHQMYMLLSNYNMGFHLQKKSGQNGKN